jgi:hypothetical protein
MKDEVKCLLIFAAIGVALLAVDRYYRVNLFFQRERFQNPMSMIQRCGVDFPGCPHGLECMNGFCLSKDVPIMHETLVLPVMP